MLRPAGLKSGVPWQCIPLPKVLTEEVWLPRAVNAAADEVWLLKAVRLVVEDARICDVLLKGIGALIEEA